MTKREFAANENGYSSGWKAGRDAMRPLIEQMRNCLDALVTNINRNTPMYRHTQTVLKKANRELES